MSISSIRVLYGEYEHKSGGGQILKEGEGHDVESDFLTPNSEARKEHINEMELKLILSSSFQRMEFHGEHAGSQRSLEFTVEFGYALGPAARWH